MVRTFDLLWFRHCFRSTLGEINRRGDDVNEAIRAWTSIGSLCSKHFGGNRSQSPTKVFIVWQFLFCKFGYVLGRSELSHCCHFLCHVGGKTVVCPTPHPCSLGNRSRTDDLN